MPNGARHYAFTLNNYTDDDIVSLARAAESSEVSYLIFGKEVSASGTPHLQGHVYFGKQHSIAKAKKGLSIEAHFSLARNVLRSIEYCKKDGDFREYGTPPDVSRNPGSRTDFEDLRATIASGVTELSLLREKYPSLCARYPRFVEAVIRDLKPKFKVADHPLRDWQSKLLAYCSGTPHGREILFVVDPKGNAGKTYIADFLEEKLEGVQVMIPAKLIDLAYELRETTKVLIVDVPRSKTGYIEYLYSFLEFVKNGRVFSSKYEPVTKRFPPPHVVVMMNTEPDMSALSEDRYAFMRVDN